MNHLIILATGNIVYFQLYNVWNVTILIAYKDWVRPIFLPFLQKYYIIKKKIPKNICLFFKLNIICYLNSFNIRNNYFVLFSIFSHFTQNFTWNFTQHKLCCSSLVPSITFMFQYSSKYFNIIKITEPTNLTSCNQKIFVVSRQFQHTGHFSTFYQCKLYISNILGIFYLSRVFILS